METSVTDKKGHAPTKGKRKGGTEMEPTNWKQVESTKRDQQSRTNKVGTKRHQQRGTKWNQRSGTDEARPWSNKGEPSGTNKI